MRDTHVVKNTSTTIINRRTSNSGGVGDRHGSKGRDVRSARPPISVKVGCVMYTIIMLGIRLFSEFIGYSYQLEQGSPTFFYVGPKLLKDASIGYLIENG